MSLTAQDNLIRCWVQTLVQILPVDTMKGSVQVLDRLSFQVMMLSHLSSMLLVTLTRYLDCILVRVIGSVVWFRCVLVGLHCGLV